MRSLYDNVSVGAIHAVLNSSVGIVSRSPSVDTRGYNSAVLRVNTSAVGTNILVGQGGSVVVVLEESADNSTFTTAVDNTGATIGSTITATTTAVLGSYRIEGLGLQRLRYLRVKQTSNFAAVASASAIFTAVAVIELGRAYINPVPTTPGGTVPPATSNT